jgi:putative tryptophan/tyrosine transport system substrate-binding protein
MRRRAFIAALGVAVAWPLAARAQRASRIPRIGLLLTNSEADEEKRGIPAAFLVGLSRLGYVEGKTVVIEARFADGKPDRMPALAAELVASKVDVIVTPGQGVSAAHSVTTTVPIVAAAAGDLVADGLARSLTHPGGNVTGQSIFAPQMLAKRLERLKQTVPSLRRAGLLRRPGFVVSLEAMAGLAKALDVELEPFDAADAAGYEAAFSSASAASIGGFVISDAGQFYGDAGIIASIANRHGMPTVGAPQLAARGILIGYGVDVPELFRHAATFVDKILKGANPGDIPIEQATKLVTIVNLKTARSLDLEVPPAILAAADEVIE